MNYAKALDGDVVVNDEIPALAQALSWPPTTADAIGFGQLIRYWVVDSGNGGRPIPELNGLKMRPVIMVSDLLAGEASVWRRMSTLSRRLPRTRVGYPVETSTWSSDRPGMLETGFRACATDSDLLLHQLGWTNSSLDFFDDLTRALDSTSAQYSVAINFTQNNGWVYRMRVPYAINTTAALGPFAVSAYSAERREIRPTCDTARRDRRSYSDSAGETQTVQVKSPEQILHWAETVQAKFDKRKDLASE